MMGRPQKAAAKLFYTSFNLDQRVRADNPLRAIRAAIDFDFVRPLVRPFYGTVGNPSVDPALLLKLMFILFYDQVRSERALMASMSERLDWLWFCDLDIDSTIPDHSVISKARKLWGTEVFGEFFSRVLNQCVEANLVDGTLVHVDSSILTANADKTKLQTVLRVACQKFYDRLEEDCPQPPGAKEQPQAQAIEAPPTPPAPPQEPAASEPGLIDAITTSHPPEPPAPQPQDSPASEPPLGTAVSLTDPEARLTRKNGKTTLGYKDHRVVDDRCGIITATATTPASVNDGAMLMGLLDAHEENTGQEAHAVAADSAYGTGENYEQLRDRDMRPAIPHQQQKGAPGKFGRDQFHYDAAEDCYVCPAGQKLHRTGKAPDRDHVEYHAGTKVCAACPMREQCTGKTGRSFKRHVHQDAIDWADHLLSPGTRQSMMRRRRIRAEGSFADALRHGFKRARWRGLAKMTIQNLLIATIQNVRKLLKHARKGRGAPALAENLRHLAKTMRVWSRRAVQWLAQTRDDCVRLEFSYQT
jgi:IS5 family transposase